MAMSFSYEKRRNSMLTDSEALPLLINRYHWYVNCLKMQALCATSTCLGGAVGSVTVRAAWLR